MSGIVFLVPCAAFLLCFAGWFILKRIFSAYGWPRSHWPTLLCLVAFPLSCAGLWPLLFALTSSQGRGVSPAQANASLRFFTVPPAAREVNFKHCLLCGTVDEADFAIDEADFMAWMKSQNWEPQVFQRNPDWPMPAPTATIPDHVKFGFYYFQSRSHDDFLLVIFDHDTSRATVSRVTY